MCQAPPPKPSTMEMSSVFGRKREEDEDAEEVGWRFSSLFGCKRIAHEGLLMRWKWLKGLNMLQSVEATLWCFSVSSNILEFLRFFLQKIITVFFGGDQVTIFVFFRWFFVWSWGSCFGSFRACRGAVGWKWYACCWKASENAPGGAEMETLWNRNLSFRCVVLRYLGNLILIVWRFALWSGRVPIFVEHILQIGGENVPNRFATPIPAVDGWNPKQPPRMVLKPYK